MKRRVLAIISVISILAFTFVSVASAAAVQPVVTSSDDVASEVAVSEFDQADYFLSDTDVSEYLDSVRPLTPVNHSDNSVSTYAAPSQVIPSFKKLPVGGIISLNALSVPSVYANGFYCPIPDQASSGSLAYSFYYRANPLILNTAPSFSGLSVYLYIKGSDFGTVPSSLSFGGFTGSLILDTDISTDTEKYYFVSRNLVVSCFSSDSISVSFPSGMFKYGVRYVFDFYGRSWNSEYFLDNSSAGGGSSSSGGAS